MSKNNKTKFYYDDPVFFYNKFESMIYEQNLLDEEVKDLFGNLNNSMSSEKKEYVYFYTCNVLDDVRVETCNSTDVFLSNSKNKFVPKHLYIKHDFETDEILFGIDTFKKEIYYSWKEFNKPGVLSLINRINQKRYIIHSNCLYTCIIDDLKSLYDIYGPKHKIQELQNDVQKYTMSNFILQYDLDDSLKDFNFRQEFVDYLKNEAAKKNKLYNK